MDDPFAVHPSYFCPDCKRAWGEMIGQAQSPRICPACLGPAMESGDLVKGIHLGPLGAVKPFRPSKSGKIPLEAIAEEMRPLLDQYPTIAASVEGWAPKLAAMEAPSEQSDLEASAGPRAAPGGEPPSVPTEPSGERGDHFGPTGLEDPYELGRHDGRLEELASLLALVIDRGDRQLALLVTSRLATLTREEA